MPIEFRCPSCTQQLRVPDTAAGKGAKCPKCQSVVTVPAASEDPGGASTLPSFGNPPTSPPPLSPPPLAPSASSPGSPFGAAPASKPADPFGGFSPAGKPASSNPFGDFAAGGGGGGSGSGNPFATSAPSPFGGSPNPYAAPAAVSALQTEIDRSGLPWEVEGASPSSWFSTVQAVLGDPSTAFRRMRLTGGVGQPMLFNVIGAAIGVIVPALMQLGQLFVIPHRGNNMEPAAAAGIYIGIMAVQVLFGATIGLLLMAGIVHLCLMLFGGANEGYEATVRVVGYSHGSGSALQLIPCLGICVALVWTLVAEIVGLAQAHRTDVWRAVMAVLTSIVVIIGCGVSFVVVIAGAVAAVN